MEIWSEKGPQRMERFKKGPFKNRNGFNKSQENPVPGKASWPIVSGHFWPSGPFLSGKLTIDANCNSPPKKALHRCKMEILLRKNGPPN